MSKAAQIVFGGGYDAFDAVSLTSEDWDELENKTRFAFSEECRAAIIASCRRYLKDAAAFESMPQAGEFLKQLKWLEKRFAELLEWWGSSARIGGHQEFNYRQRLVRAMERAFVRTGPSSQDLEKRLIELDHRDDREAEIDKILAEVTKDPDANSRGLPALFEDMSAVYREIQAERKSLEERSHPLVEREPLVWDEWIRSMVKVVEKTGFTVSSRGDDEGSENPSPFVILIHSLQKYLPLPRQKHMHSIAALAAAISRARA